MTNVQRWLSHYPKEIPVTLDYDERPLHAFLKDSAKTYGEKTALTFMGKTMSFSELYSESKKMAHYMQSLGLKKDDRVAIMLPNCPQGVISYYATLLSGAIVVQTNPLYTERELEYQLKDSGATFIICLDILLPRVTTVRDSTSIKHTIVTGIKDYLPFPKNLIYPFIQKRQYNMVVKVEQDKETHVWTKMITETSEQYKKVEVNPLEDLALLRSEEHTSELQSRGHLVCRLLLEKKKK